MMVHAVEKNRGGEGPRVGKAAVLSRGVRQVSLRPSLELGDQSCLRSL